MRGKNYQTITLSILIAVVAISLSSQTVFAGEITYSVNPGANMVTFRDITSTEPTPPLTFSLDNSTYFVGDTAILTITDFNANLDVAVPDFATATVIQTSSTTIVDAEETGPSTTQFDGAFVITDNITGLTFSECFTDCVTPGNSFIEYTGDSPEAARAKITLPLTTGGNVSLSDVTFNENELVNADIFPVIGAINVDLIDGASFSGVPTVVLSYANANLDAGDNCDFTANPDQADEDFDRVGDACEELDSDSDGILDSADNCIFTSNADQADANSDGVGDACASLDTDGDGDLDANDNCVYTPNSNQQDSDFDGEGDACEFLDSDGDGIVDGGRIAPAALEMYHKAPGQSWEIVTISCLAHINAFPFPEPCDYFDSAAKTLTSEPTGAGFSGTDGQGQYVLAFYTGAGGGGGGGLVRPSLVVNALAGVVGGGGFGEGGAGGSAYSSPTLQLSNLVKLGAIEVPPQVEQMIYNHDATVPTSAFDLDFFADFEDFVFPLVINDKGFVLSGFETTLDTQTLKTNTPNTIKFNFYEADKIQHFSLYMNLRDANTAIHQSDTQILYFDGQPIDVVDPNGFFESVDLTVNDLDDIKREVVIEITFAKPMETTNMIVRSWDPYLNSYDTHILDAIQVIPEEEIESPLVDVEEPVIEQLQSQTIPIWIKNNAAWWSEQQIADSDFIAGIEYLIKNGIINVPGVEVGTTTTKNNAGWWSESLITDEDFIEAMQWLVAQGVIQI
jgi:hypothetical protein